KQFDALRAALDDCGGIALTPRGKKKAHPARNAGTALAPAHPTEAASGAEDPDDGAGPRPGEPPPAVQVERIRRFYEPIFKNRYENATIRLRDIEQLEQIAGGYRSRGRFITELTIDPPPSTSDLAGPPCLEEDYLILSTIHSAKGCEWDVVHIIHAADGNIPSDMAIQDQDGVEEERRLL